MIDATEMSDMIDSMTGKNADDKGLAERLLAQVKEEGVSPVGPGGLLFGWRDRSLTLL